MHINNKLNTYAKAKKQQGASMVYIAAFMAVIGFTTVLVSNVGQMAYDRIVLQQTVDEATLAAANIQAIGLNEIADLNRAAYEEYANAQRVLGMVPWYDKATANAVVEHFQEIFDWIEFYREDANERFAVLAHEYAHAVMAENMPEEYGQGILSLAPVEGASNEYLMDYEKLPLPVFYTYYTSSCSFCSANPTAIVGNFSETKFISKDRRASARRIIAADRIIPLPDIYIPEVAWIKDPSKVTYAGYELRQEREKFAVGDGLFDEVFPTLTAYASAKPSQGVVFAGQTGYVPLLKALDRHNPLPSIPSLGLIEH